ncbi:Haloacid dehalogenase-like hydrolase (HAD) superfamily protein [Striga hermonthica]|uniref:Haloacid dehalogenase-like hydrolase (HAD) superfamily protein n=1 Tax=Striga hermonthica TaxID=68872 RepID=A0A9N7RLZ2_STRHE|nr:Haloacid dehalogenase-like hydrolase (HAD) superfamily protein [Striga hermonthica]
MVSKIVKRTPTKSLRNRNKTHGRRRKSPAKNPAATAAAAVVASLNRSVHTCRRRLIRIFAKLAPTKKTPSPRRSKRGYQILDKPSAAADGDPSLLLLPRSLFAALPPPPPPSARRKTVFLDLDETLVHSTPNIPPERYDFAVTPLIDGEKVDFFVLKRPFVDEFLSFLSRSSFEIVIFTAGIKEYASLVIDRLDPKGLISYRLYRDSCREIDGRFVKDLEIVGRELDRAVIVDDNPCSYQLQPGNAVPVRPFTDDLRDEELKGLMGFFGGFFGSAEDVRDAVRDYLDDLNVGEKSIYSV